MKGKKLAAGALCMVLQAASVPVSAAAKFDAGYYASLYPDVVAALGTGQRALYNHYLTYGMKEGRLPYEGANPGEAVNGFRNVLVNVATGAAETVGTPAASGVVPVNQLANLSSLRKKMTDAELNQAYNAALEIVTPYIGLSREEQLQGIASALRSRFDAGMAYSMTSSHYNDPYEYLILGEASCAVRASLFINKTFSEEAQTV